jgi:hypothetical protein
LEIADPGAIVTPHMTRFIAHENMCAAPQEPCSLHA